MKRPLALSIAFLFSAQVYAQENIFSPPNQAEVKQSGGQCEGKPCEDGPGFRKRGGAGGGKFRQMMKSAAPGMREVNMIPSLSADQRKQVRQIYQSSRQEIQPLVAELRELKQKSHGGKGSASWRTAGADGSKVNIKADAKADNIVTTKAAENNAGEKLQASNLSLTERKQARQRIFALAQQIKDKRIAAWQKVKGLLSPDQVQELERMHQGQIVGPGQRNFRSPDQTPPGHMSQENVQ
jgi:hypothetical protein